jgi:hypothetical protein
MRKTVYFISVLALAAAIGDPASAACGPNDKMDGTTADYAKQKIEAAGFQQVRHLTKGCDNYWHGVAKKDGLDVYVVLTPKGEVMIEET